MASFLYAVVAAAVVAPLLRVCAAEVCASEAESVSGLKLLQKESRTRRSRGVSDVVELGQEREERFSTSESWCYEKESALFGNCWAAKPNASVPACTVDSDKTACRCSDVICAIDQLNAATPTTGRCREKWIYVPDGSRHKSAGAVSVTGVGEEVYCKDMVKNDQWKEKHLVKLPSDPPMENSKTWWSCWSPNTWKDGKCHRKTRYLGESCWNGQLGAGRCEGSDKSYEEHSTSCYKGTCVPYAWAKDRMPCSCKWFGWNFIVVCSATGDACGGHACVLNTGDGKKYCDWASSQDW